MTDYDFIDPDLPENREEKQRNEERMNSVLPEGETLKDHPELRNRALVFGPADEDYADTDKVAAGENSEDNRGFLGRAYNFVKNAL